MQQNFSAGAAMTWHQHLHQCRFSQATVAEYCQREGISVVAFNYWRKKLGGTRRQNPMANLNAIERPIQILE